MSVYFKDLIFNSLLEKETFCAKNIALAKFWTHYFPRYFLLMTIAPNFCLKRLKKVYFVQVK